jgi:hypothetical protein
MHLALVIGRTRSAFDQTLPMRYQFGEEQLLQVNNVSSRCNSCALTSFRGMLSHLGPRARTKAPSQSRRALMEGALADHYQTE